MLSDRDAWLVTGQMLASVHASSLIILLDTPQSAQEVAYMLGGEWDGCNSVSLATFDDEAILTAAALQKAEFCQFGNCCQISVRREPDALNYQD